MILSWARSLCGLRKLLPFTVAKGKNFNLVFYFLTVREARHACNTEILLFIFTSHIPVTNKARVF